MALPPPFTRVPVPFEHASMDQVVNDIYDKLAVLQTSKPSTTTTTTTTTTTAGSTLAGGGGGGGGSSSLTIEVNGTLASSQTLLNLIAGTGITISDGGGGFITFSLATLVGKYSTTFTSQTSITVTHSLGTEDIIVAVWDSNGNQVIPQTMVIVDSNNVDITFGASESGSVVVIG